MDTRLTPSSVLSVAHGFVRILLIPGRQVGLSCDLWRFHLLLAERWSIVWSHHWILFGFCNSSLLCTWSLAILDIIFTLVACGITCTLFELFTKTFNLLLLLIHRISTLRRRLDAAALVGDVTRSYGYCM